MVFRINLSKFLPRIAVFSKLGFGIQSDFGIQLNETANLKEKIFPPMKKTFLIFHDFDELKNVKSVVKNKSVMSDNRDVFMANFMTRNMKNINTLQTLTGIIGTDRSKWIKYEPSKSNERNYVELFMSSMDSMGSDIILRSNIILNAHCSCTIL